MRQKDQPDFILLGSHEVGKPAKRLIQQYEDMFGKKIDLDALVFLNTGHLFGKGSQYYILHAVEEGLHYPTKSGSSRTMSRAPEAKQRELDEETKASMKKIYPDYEFIPTPF